jgi:transcriptional regulator with XRE-family HTH domain
VADSSGPSARDVGKAQLERLGRIIREQRTAAELSLRELAARTNVSNPYLSQLERGLHEPSVRVLKAIAAALNMSAEALMVQAGLIDPTGETTPATRVADAIRTDPRLTDDQKAALLSVYRSYTEAGGPTGDMEAGGESDNDD